MQSSVLSQAEAPETLSCAGMLPPVLHGAEKGNKEKLGAYMCNNRKPGVDGNVCRQLSSTQEICPSELTGQVRICP